MGAAKYQGKKVEVKIVYTERDWWDALNDLLEAIGVERPETGAILEDTVPTLHQAIDEVKSLKEKVSHAKPASRRR